MGTHTKACGGVPTYIGACRTPQVSTCHVVYSDTTWYAYIVLSAVSDKRSAQARSKGYQPVANVAMRQYRDRNAQV